jgi:FkbM family methyltransferase
MFRLDRIRFSFLELILVCMLTAVVATVVSRTITLQHLRLLIMRSHFPQLEYKELQARYGPHRYSHGVEEWVIRDYFQDRRDGVFLDVGASHYQTSNNTYYLESVLGWSGLAIEARSEFGADYQRHRPRTRFVAMFASDAVAQLVKLYVPPNNIWNASADRTIVTRESSGAMLTEREVPTTTLNQVLTEAGVERIDFLNMDIELGEPKALAGFDVERYRPQLVCIEGEPAVRQQILDYFREHNYRLIGKYLRVDGVNLYFEPLR